MSNPLLIPTRSSSFGHASATDSNQVLASSSHNHNLSNESASLPQPHDVTAAPSSRQNEGLSVLPPGQLDVILPRSEMAFTDLNSMDSVDVPGGEYAGFPTNSHPMVTRSKAGISKKKDFSEYQCYSAAVNTKNYDHLAFFSGFTCVGEINDASEPSNYRAAAGISHWENAMREEIDALMAQGTWTLVPAPRDRHVVGCKWVYKIKKNPDGSVARYKLG